MITNFDSGVIVIQSRLKKVWVQVYQDGKPVQIGTFPEGLPMWRFVASIAHVNIPLPADSVIVYPAALKTWYKATMISLQTPFSITYSENNDVILIGR